MLKILSVFSSLVFLAFMVGCSGAGAARPAPSSANEIISYSINGSSGIITGNNILITLPYGSEVTNLVAQFKYNGVSIKVGDKEQISGQTANDFTNPIKYSVTASDHQVAVYTVTVKVSSYDTKGIIAFSINDNAGVIQGNSISVVMPYGTDLTNLVADFSYIGSQVKVGSVVQISGVNTNNFTNPVIYTVYAADGSTQSYTVTVKVASNSAKDITSFSINGIIAIFGSNNTISLILPYGTNKTELVADFTTTGSNVMVNGVEQISGETTNDFTQPQIYTVDAADGSSKSYVVTVNVAAISAKDITSFSILNTYAEFGFNNTISLTLPYGTDLKSLVATFTTTGNKVTVDGVEQVSGQTTNNFTHELTYKVEAADGTTKDYVVKVNLAANSSKNITSFSILGNTAEFGFNNTISLTLPYGTDLKSLIAIFTTTGSKVTVNGVEQVSGQTANDFTNPVTYTVYADDGTTANYIVTVTVAPLQWFVVGNQAVTDDGRWPAMVTSSFGKSLYLAYTNSIGTYVKSYTLNQTNSQWQFLRKDGSDEVAAPDAKYLDLSDILYSGVEFLYIIYKDGAIGANNGNAMVQRYIPILRSWRSFGYVLKTGLKANFTNIVAINDNTSHVVLQFEDGRLNNLVALQGLIDSWSYWGANGGDIAILSSLQSMAIDLGNVPYIAYKEEFTLHLRAVKLIQNVWQPIEQGINSKKVSSGVKLLINGKNIPVIAFITDDKRIELMEFNNATSSWSNIQRNGENTIAGNGISNLSFASDNLGNLYLAYIDQDCRVAINSYEWETGAWRLYDTSGIPQPLENCRDYELGERVLNLVWAPLPSTSNSNVEITSYPVGMLYLSIENQGGIYVYQHKMTF